MFTPTSLPQPQDRENRAAESDCPAPLGLVRKQDVARAVCVSPRCIENWVRARRIPIIRIGPRLVRFHLPSVLAALRRFEVEEVRRTGPGWHTGSNSRSRGNAE